MRYVNDYSEPVHFLYDFFSERAETTPSFAFGARVADGVVRRM